MKIFLIVLSYVILIFAGYCLFEAIKADWKQSLGVIGGLSWILIANNIRKYADKFTVAR